MKYIEETEATVTEEAMKGIVAYIRQLEGACESYSIQSTRDALMIGKLEQEHKHMKSSLEALSFLPATKEVAEKILSTIPTRS